MTPAHGWIYVIGDSHIGLADGDETKILAWLERLEARSPRALYLDGDVFHYFIGHANFLTRPIEAFFAKLRQMRDAGIAIHYVEGNRDFFLDGSIAGRSVSSVALEAEFEAGPRRVLVTHGDLVNVRDRGYRFWRWLSKNGAMRFAVKLIPEGIAKRIVDSMEQRLARTNFRYKKQIPTKLMEEFGRSCARTADGAGYDLVVFGHFHRKIEIDTEGAHVIVLPAWYENGEALAIDPETGRWEWVVV